MRDGPRDLKEPERFHTGNRVHAQLHCIKAAVVIDRAEEPLPVLDILRSQFILVKHIFKGCTRSGGQSGGDTVLMVYTENVTFNKPVESGGSQRTVRKPSGGQHFVQQGISISR